MINNYIILCENNNTRDVNIKNNISTTLNSIDILTSSPSSLYIGVNETTTPDFLLLYLISTTTPSTTTPSLGTSTINNEIIIKNTQSDKPSTSSRLYLSSTLSSSKLISTLITTKSISSTVSNQTNAYSTLSVITCKLTSDCPGQLTCIARLCINIAITTQTKQLTTQTTETNTNYSLLKNSDFNPLLWTLIIGLPSIIIIVIIIVIIIYCRHSCKLTSIICRRKTNRTRTLQSQVILDILSRTADIYCDESDLSISQNDNNSLSPPLYKDVTSNPQGFTIDNKDLFNISLENLPTYSSWSKKHNPGVS